MSKNSRRKKRQDKLVEAKDPKDKEASARDAIKEKGGSNKKAPSSKAGAADDEEDDHPANSLPQGMQQLVAKHIAGHLMGQTPDEDPETAPENGQQQGGAPEGPGTPSGQDGADGTGDPGQDQTPPQMMAGAAGPEIVSELPPPMEITYDSAGAPDKYTLDGHTVRWDGRDYVLAWEPEKYVYRLVDPMSMQVRLRVKPEQVSTIQPDRTLSSVVGEHLLVRHSVKSLITGDSLVDHVNLLLRANPILLS